MTLSFHSRLRAGAIQRGYEKDLSFKRHLAGENDTDYTATQQQFISIITVFYVKTCSAIQIGRTMIIFKQDDQLRLIPDGSHLTCCSLHLNLENIMGS